MMLGRALVATVALLACTGSEAVHIREQPAALELEGESLHVAGASHLPAGILGESFGRHAQLSLANAPSSVQLSEEIGLSNSDNPPAAPVQRTTLTTTSSANHARDRRDPPEPTTTTVSPLTQFNPLTSSAINMGGWSYLVNFRTVDGSVLTAAAACVAEPTCIAFDYTFAEATGWLHRIPPQCASRFGANFFNGTSPGTTLYVYLPTLRPSGGNTCNFSAPPIIATYNSNPVNIPLVVLVTLFGGLVFALILSMGIVKVTVWKVRRDRAAALAAARALRQQEENED
eukprot:m.72308 g.72308  ORF g.72308 m.72308 type:complete len:287 (+) comp50241_c0_seq1:119-979(+)